MLTDKQCKNAVCPPDKKRVRFTDSAGLYLEVSPGGSKRWFWKPTTTIEGRAVISTVRPFFIGDKGFRVQHRSS